MRFLLLLIAAVDALGAQKPRPEVTQPATAGPAFFSLYAGGIYHFTVATDSSGNLYIAGTVQSNIFTATAGAVQTQYAGGTCINADPHQPGTYPCSDVFVLKLDPSGAIVYATYLGGSGNEFVTAIAADAAGNAYVTGGTTSGDFPVTAHALFPKPSGQGDGFVAKISPAGDHLEYSTYLNDTSFEALAIDSQGNAYLATPVFAAFSTFPTTPGAYQPKSSSAGSTGLIAKISADGSALLYSTFLGGTSPIGSGDSALGIAVDAAGNAYVTGSTSSPDFPVTPGAFQSHIGGQFNTAFVSKLSSGGSRLMYSTLLGGTGLDSGYQIKVDGRGSAYVFGRTSSKDFPITPGAFQSNITGAVWSPGDFQPPFVAKVSADGTALEYATYFSGALALDVDSNGDTYILGQAAAGFPVTSGAFQRCMNGGGVDLFVAQLTADGKLAGATYLGGSGSESPVGIATASQGRPWVAGTTTSTDFPGLIGNVPTQPLLIAEKLVINDTGKQNGPCIALAIQNGANFIEGPIAPGELVTIRGSGIGPDTPAYQPIGPDGKLATQLAGVQVLMNGVPAPLLYVQSQQIHAQVPWETTGFETMPFPSSPVSIDVIYNGAATNSISIPVVSASPAILYSDGTQMGFLDFSVLQAAVLNSDNSVNTFQNPAPRGSVISIYATGGGMLAPAGVDGGLWPRSPLSVLSAPAAVLIGGVSADVLYAGSAPGLLSGVLQINARVPEQLPVPEVVVLDVTVQIGNRESLPVSIAIK